MQENNFNVNDDDFIIEKGFNLDNSQDISEKKIRKHRKKSEKSALKNTIWIVSMVLISLLLAFFLIYAVADYLGIAFGRGGECEMNIEIGSSTTEICEKLEETGAVKMPTLFKLYSKLKGYDSSYKYGLYTFDTEAGYEEIARMLMNDGAKAESIKVTIPEGTGINDYTKNVNGEEKVIKGIGTILEEKGVCTKADFLYAVNEAALDLKLLENCDSERTYYTLEGYLFPDTYDFYAYDSEECARFVVKRMTEQADKKITDAMYKRAEEMGYTMNEILTMASIVQMESGNNTEEMANVAGVFYNRLKSENFTTLGSSPTCYYGESFKQDDGRYNTYNVKGLPPGPLCSPGIDAINAALYPTENSPYYYFVTDSSGNFYYHKTLSEQNQTINRLQGELNWTYEYFE